ncbi:hypothetical protein B0H13DRAFT_2670036 [Mycena leptocephala]|nr:hypothetical protein B0H13DRAFT_2670036 [Mycena leptocephala]
MYPGSPPAHVFPSRSLGPAALATALFHGQEDHDGDVYRPFVPGFDGIERRAALMRNPIFTDIFSVLTRGADATMSWTPTPTSSPRPARRRCRRSVVYDPNGHPTLLVATSHQNPAPFLQTKIIVVLAIHLPTDSYPRHNLHATESLEGSSTRYVFTLSLARTSAACHVHTHHVRQRPRTSTQPPPPPFTSAPTSCSRHSVECTQTRLCPSTVLLAAADRISTCLGCAHMTSFLGQLGGLGTGGDAIHPRRARNLRLYGAHARLRGVAPTGSLRVRYRDLERVLSAIRASVSEAPANPGMGNKVHTPSRPPLPDHLYFHNVFVAQATAECTTARTFGKAKASTVVIRCPAQCATIVHDGPRSTFADRLYSPASIRLSIHVSISPHVASPPMRLGSSNPSPPSDDTSPAAPPARPRAFAFGACKLQYVFEAVHTRAK